MNSSNSPQHLDPLASVLAAAPLDDEPVTESEAKAIAEGKRDVAAGRVVSAAEVRAWFGLPRQATSASDSAGSLDDSPIP